MITGHIHTNQPATALPPMLQKAICFLQTTDLAAHEPGRFELDWDGIPIVLQVLDLTTASRDTLRPEVHRANIDVQFLAAGGPECAAWYPDLGDNQVAEDLLDTPRDILFYHNNPNVAESLLTLTVGSYAIYFPWDVHVPAIQSGSTCAPIRKIVLKVPVSACL